MYHNPLSALCNGDLLDKGNNHDAFRYEHPHHHLHDHSDLGNSHHRDKGNNHDAFLHDHLHHDVLHDHLHHDILPDSDPGNNHHRDDDQTLQSQEFRPLEA